MASSETLDFIVPVHRSGLKGLRTTLGDPIVIPLQADVKFVLGVYDALGAFELAPAETNLTVKLHLVNDDGTIGSELTSVSQSVAAGTEAGFKGGTGHASVTLDGQNFLASTYAGGQVVRISIWGDAVMLVQDSVTLIDTGSSVIFGTISLAQLQTEAHGWYAPTASTFKTSNVASFDDANSEYLSIADGSQTGLDVGTSDFSISLWFLADDVTGTKVLVSKGNGAANDLGYAIFLNGSTLTFRTGDGSSSAEVTQASILAGVWYHALAIADRDGNLELFVNGASAGTVSALANTMDNAAAFHIGATPTPSSYHDGRVCMVGVWGATLLTSGNATTLYNSGTPVPYDSMGALQTGLGGFWELNERSGTRYDRTSNNNDLTDNASVTADFFYKPVAEFTAANSEYLEIADASLSPASSLSPVASNFTVAAWVKVAADGSARGIIGKWVNSGDREWLLTKEGTNDFQFFVSTNGTNGVSATASGLADGNWHFIVGVWDGTNIKISKDGATFVSTAQSSNISEGTAPVRIGDYASGSAFMDGQIGPCGFWTRALSQADIVALYYDGNARGYTDLTTAQKVSLVSWWELDERSGTRSDSHGANNLTDQATVTHQAGIIRGLEYTAPEHAAAVKWTNSTSQSDSDNLGDPEGFDPNGLPVVAASSYLDTNGATVGLHARLGTVNHVSSIVLLAQLNSMAASQFFFDGWAPGMVSGDDRNVGYWEHTGATLRIYAGTDQNGPSTDTSLHVFVFIFDGAASEVHQDGASTDPTTGSPGAQVLNGLTIGSRFDDGSPLDATIRRLFVLERRLTAAEISELVTLLNP